MIADTIVWLKRFTTTDFQLYLDDMEWVHHHLINSMDDELADIVSSTLKHDYSNQQKGGPLTFALMIDNCINLSDEAIDALKDSIKSFDIKTVPGENVEFVTSRFLYAFKR